MSILEETKTYLREQQERLEKQLVDLSTEQAHRENLAQILDECLEGLKPRYTYIRWRFEFKFNTTREAREFTGRVLEKLQIDKAEKEFEGCYKEPLWRYVISYNNISVRVEPADVDEGCKPITKVSALTYWVCERKED